MNSYDALARLTQTALNNQWGHTLDGYTYSYDPLGLRTNITRNLGLTTSTVTVGYDSIGQITSWLAKEAGGTARFNEQLGWAYDAAHNLLWRANNSLVQNFLVDAANELTNVTRTGTFTLSGATPAPATSVTVNNQAAQTYGDFTFARTNLALANGQNSFTNIAVNLYGLKVTNTLTVNLPQSVTLGFDNNGNLTNDGTRSFSYDSENQLTNVTVANKFKKDFVFDGLNRLRIKREYGWTGSSWTKTNEIHFIYDGAVIIQHRDSNNVPVLTLTRGLDLSGTRQRAGGIGGLLAMTEGSGASSYFHADALGNVTALMDSSENTVGRRLYGPFGNALFLGGAKAAINPYWFSSQLSDADTGLDHFLRRDYAPELSRWTSPDPIGERGGINLYRPMHNNPMNWVDPYGLFMTVQGDNPVADTVLGNAYQGYQGPGPDTTPPANGFMPFVGNMPGYDVGLAAMFAPNEDAAQAAIQNQLDADAGAGIMALPLIPALFEPALLELGPESALAGAVRNAGRKVPCLTTVPVSRWGSPGLQPGDYVMKGPVSPYNYLMSGKYQPRWFPTFGQPPNIPVPYSSGITYNVPPSSLSFPPGPLGVPKGLLGQRIYNP